jgi:protein involved in polysaccharide export with SLBB domain
VNFVKCSGIYGNILKTKIILVSLITALLSVYLVGCGDKVQLPSAEELTAFEAAGPSVPAVDMQRVARAKMEVGAYRVVPGDVLELNMPIVLQVLVTKAPDFPDQIVPYLCRVRDNGAIVLPMAGEIQAAGKTLAEIESAVIDAYYPTYTKTPPSVIARVAEYKTHKASITGAVQNPGIYELRSDQMSLVALLMQAGGIVEEGATRIRITHAEGTNAGSSKQACYKPYNHAIEYVAQSDETEEVRPALHYLDSTQDNGTDVQMTFQQTSRSSAIGRLTIRHEQTILLSEQIDITNENQRWCVLDKLAEADSRVATDEVGRIWVRLCELAELLKNPGVQMTEDRGRKNLTSDSRFLISDNADDRGSDETIVLPVRGLNIPFADVALHDGDTIIVEGLETQLFTVIGLVNKPGNFLYPPDVQYNLMQAIAFAGGLYRSAAPRYATVYRLKQDGSIVRAPFQLITSKKGTQLTEALNIPIKPGDIVAIEDTPRTRKNEFLQRIFNVHIGAYVPVTEWMR